MLSIEAVEVAALVRDPVVPGHCLRNTTPDRQDVAASKVPDMPEVLQDLKDRGEPNTVLDDISSTSTGSWPTHAGATVYCTPANTSLSAAASMT